MKTTQKRFEIMQTKAQLLDVQAQIVDANLRGCDRSEYCSLVQLEDDLNSNLSCLLYERPKPSPSEQQIQQAIDLYY